MISTGLATAFNPDEDYADSLFAAYRARGRINREIGLNSKYAR